MKEVAEFAGVWKSVVIQVTNSSLQEILLCLERHPPYLAQLHNPLTQEWLNIDVVCIQKLDQSMPNQITAASFCMLWYYMLAVSFTGDNLFLSGKHISMQLRWFIICTQIAAHFHVLQRL